MKSIWQVFADRQSVLAAVITLVAVLAFNSWLLAFFLNSQLMYKGGSISELTVHGQPHAVLFQALDVLAGGLFAVLALIMRRMVPVVSRSAQVLIYGGLIFGVANIADALFSLPCSETFDPSCHIPITINWSHFNFPSHGYSSVLIAILYFVLPLAGVFYARLHQDRLFFKVSLITLLVAVASLISATWEYLDLHGFSVKASGWAQGGQMLVLGVWYISLFLTVNSALKKEQIKNRA